MRRKVSILCVVVLAAISSPLQGALSQGADQAWPQWRGAGRDGLVPEGSTPPVWPSTFARAWGVEVGEGYASPVVAGGRVFVHSRRDPAELVTAVDLSTGGVVWQQSYPAPYAKNSYAGEMAKGPNATPLIAGGRLLTLGATGVLTAWDMVTGRHLWQKDFSKLVDFSKLFCGTAASPLLVDDRVIVQVGSDVHGGTIVALDPATGSAVWEWTGPGPGYASPMLFTVDGVRQIVTLTNRSVIGLDAATGRELWSAPFANEWHENIVTPIWTGDAIVVSSKEQGTVAYRPARGDGGWRVVERWRNREITMYMSSPVAGDGVVYGLSDKRRGSFVALDASTGALRWQSTGREAVNATVWLTPSRLLYLTDEARLVIVPREAGARAFPEALRIELGTGAVWSAPVFLGPDLLVKDASSLVRLRPGA
jgi:outer membrane protein assembly factor BamB